MRRVIVPGGIVVLVGDEAARALAERGATVLPQHEYDAMERQAQEEFWDAVIERVIRGRDEDGIPTETLDTTRYSGDTWRRQHSKGTRRLR